MFTYAAKKVASLLPLGAQTSLRKLMYRAQIASDRFVTNEPEFSLLPDMLNEGDIVIDVGANIGHYTLKLAEIVGSSGRVIAIEPMRDTFSILLSNVIAADLGNVTLIQVAASEESRVACMTLPTQRQNNLPNYYRAHIQEGGKFGIFTLPIDQLKLPKVALIKIDAEGHELSVLKGLSHTIEQHNPILIVEDSHQAPRAWLEERKYKISSIAGSPNFIARRQ